VIVRTTTFAVTFTVAIMGIFLNVDELKVKLVLAGFAAASFLLAILIEVQATRDAAFTKRTLSRLIQASTPSSLFAHAVVQLAIGQARDRGLSDCLVREREQGDGYEIEMVFADEAHREAEGYFHFDHERLAQWSLLEEASLSGEIADEMFGRGPMPTADPLDNWNELATFLAAVGQGLYPDSVRDGAYALSADVKKVEIGLPYPRDAPVVPGRTKELTMHGESVPFLTFTRENLVALTGQSNVAASRTVAGWLAAAWGPPSVLGAS
jgi:hypothetical protein